MNPIVYVSRFRFLIIFSDCAERHFRPIKPIIDGAFAELDL